MLIGSKLANRSYPRSYPMRPLVRLCVGFIETSGNRRESGLTFEVPSALSDVASQVHLLALTVTQVPTEDMRAAPGSSHFPSKQFQSSRTPSLQELMRS